MAGKRIVEMQELVEKISSNCYLSFKYGGPLGENWVELKGSGIEDLKKLIKNYGKEGKNLFVKTFGPVIEQRLEKELKALEHEFQKILKYIPSSGPYDNDDIDRLLMREENNEVCWASMRYNEIKPKKEDLGWLLEKYKKGEPIEIYIDPNAESFIGEYSGSVGRIPKGYKIKLQKEN